MKTSNEKTLTGDIPLYRHKTDGGAEYLTDKFVECEGGHREGIFDGASIIVRLDGKPECDLRGVYASAPDLLAALERYVEADVGAYDDDLNKVARAAIARAKGE